MWTFSVLKLMSSSNNPAYSTLVQPIKESSSMSASSGIDFLVMVLFFFFFLKKKKKKVLLRLAIVFWGPSTWHPSSMYSVTPSRVRESLVFFQ